MTRADSPILVLSGCVALFGLLYQVNTHDLSDSVPFGGDRWDYQSPGVNQASGRRLGHGAAEDLSVYRGALGRDRWERLYHQPTGVAAHPAGECFLGGVRCSFFRTPSYPLYVASTYRVVATQ